MGILNTGRICGTSLGRQPDWPKSRDLDLVSTLHEFNHRELIDYKIPNTARLECLLPERGIMVDSGAGVGVLSGEMKEVRPNAFVIAAGAHDLDDHFIKRINAVYYGLIPESKELLIDYTGRVNLITDTYGPLSYYKNPMHVLIYYALLLCKGGVFTSISSTTRNDKAESVFGDIETWVKVKNFMKKHFHTDVTLIPTTIKSKVTDGAYLTDFITRFKIEGHSYTAKDFEYLCKQSDSEVGIPKLGSIWFNPIDGSFALQEKIWPKDKVVVEKKNDPEVSKAKPEPMVTKSLPSNVMNFLRECVRKVPAR